MKNDVDSNMEIIIGKFAMIISHLYEVLKAVNQLKEPGPQFHKMRECVCLYKLKMRLADCKCTVCSQELWKHKTQGLRVKVSQVPSYTSDDRGQLPHHEDSFVRFLFRNLPQISTTVLINRFSISISLVFHELGLNTQRKSMEAFIITRYTGNPFEERSLKKN